MIVIAQRLKDGGDEDTSAGLFAEAIKVTESDFDAGEKARGFFMLSVAAARTESSRVAALVESGIKVLNNVPSPDKNVTSGVAGPIRPQYWFCDLGVDQTVLRA